MTTNATTAAASAAAAAAAAQASAPGAATGASGKVRPGDAARVAEEFEGVFLSQMMGDMNVSFASPGAASAAGGGGKEESPFASMLRDEYAKIIGRSGGVGLAHQVMGELIRAQEAG